MAVFPFVNWIHAGGNETDVYIENSIIAKQVQKRNRNPGWHWLGFVSFSARLPFSYERFLEKRGEDENGSK